MALSSSNALMFRYTVAKDIRGTAFEANSKTSRASNGPGITRFPDRRPLLRSAAGS